MSVIPLAGLAALSAEPRRAEAVVRHLVSFAVGALLGGAMFHLMPAALRELGTGPRGFGYFLVGFLGFFILEKSLWVHAHRVVSGADGPPRPVAVLNLVGDGIHNLIDGMVIGAAYLAGPSVGIPATLAVILHEVPQELADFGVLLHGGFSVRRAIWWNVASGATALFGAVVVLAIGRHGGGVVAALLPVAAGGFVYIAASDLVPELQRVRGRTAALSQIGLIALGAAVMWGALLVE